MIGSKIDAKKAPEDTIDKVIEILETFIAPKKVIQCSAIMIPANENLAIVFGDTFIGIFLKRIYAYINPVAMSIRNQTNGMASMVINSPKIAVNPAINTNRCICK
nr:hypothetical protein [Formosa algae]